jgi:hypothetical protein
VIIKIATHQIARAPHPFRIPPLTSRVKARNKLARDNRGRKELGDNTSTKIISREKCRLVRRKKIKKRTKAYISIASLNMRGRFHNGADKWLNINQIMRNKKIGILALQETHLSPKDVDDVHRLFGKRLQVFATIDPASPQSKGVAIVINKDLSNPMARRQKNDGACSLCTE